MLAEQRIAVETVLAVVRIEAAEAAPDGSTTLGHDRLAALSGMRRSAVLRARLVLVELGLEQLAAAPGAVGTVQRILHHD